ncbi:MAG: LysR family transcriptional regulator [Thiogranum sp.]|nr:LysR family transcriptional regulator [Thiogranum sp.]
MDTELARTFLTVVAAGNFSTAAERLYVTQSTVSARIRALEDSLGCALFVRNKAGTTLTPAGRRFQKHATTLVRTVEEAKQGLGIQSGFRATLTIGGRFGLWERLLLHWLSWMREQQPDVCLRAEIGFEDDLMQRLVEGSLDIGVMYTPQSRPGLTVEHLLDEELVLVATRNDASGPGDKDYVYVDWGPEFFHRHSMHFAERGAAPLVAAIGWLGLQYILGNGGAGYFPLRLVRELLDSGKLTLVLDASRFVLPAYVVYPAEADADVFEPALEGLRQVAARD